MKNKNKKKLLTRAKSNEHFLMFMFVSGVQRKQAEAQEQQATLGWLLFSLGVCVGAENWNTNKPIT